MVYAYECQNSDNYKGKKNLIQYWHLKIFFIFLLFRQILKMNLLKKYKVEFKNCKTNIKQIKIGFSI